MRGKPLPLRTGLINTTGYATRFIHEQITKTQNFFKHLIWLLDDPLDDPVTADVPLAAELGHGHLHEPGDAGLVGGDALAADDLGIVHAGLCAAPRCES